MLNVDMQGWNNGSCFVSYPWLERQILESGRVTSTLKFILLGTSKLHPLALAVIVWLSATIGSAVAVDAQPVTWEYDPYQVQLVIAHWSSGELSQASMEELSRDVRRRLENAAGATWVLDVQPAPRELNARIAIELKSVNFESLENCLNIAENGNKLILLGIQQKAAHYTVSCRELDLETRYWGPIGQRSVAQREFLADAAMHAVLEAFSPIVRVEQSRGREATVRIRAGGLIQREAEAGVVLVGDVFRPVIRRRNRRDEIMWDQLQVVDWTYLLVTETRDHLATCSVYSASRNPLAGRVSARVERLALKVRARPKPTTIRLLSRNADHDPLQGYKVFAKDPVVESTNEQPPAILLGKTDWRGAIEVPPASAPLRLLYVKNGAHLMARLPVVPGEAPELSARLSSDDRRLETEAFVRGMENLVMDLVGRRAILAERIRRRLHQGKQEEAEMLLRELKNFKTRDDLEHLLVERQQMGLGSQDEMEQLRIDQLLTGTRQLLSEHLSPDLIATLEREVAQAGQANAKSP
jgi:hypothetical protein